MEDRLISTENHEKTIIIPTNEISVQVDSASLMGYMKEIRKKSNRYSTNREKTGIPYARSKINVQSISNIPLISSGFNHVNSIFPVPNSENFVKELSPEKSNEFKLPTPNYFTKKRSKSNEHQVSTKYYSNRIKIFEKISHKDYTNNISLKKKIPSEKHIRSSCRFTSLNNIFVDLSAKLMPKPPIIKMKKLTEYRKYTPSPIYKHRIQESVRKKVKILDLTVSNSKN